MAIFAVEHIPEFETRQKVHKLIRNGRCFIDEFENEIEQDENIAPELDELFATIEDVANGKMIPKNQYRKLLSSDQFSVSVIKGQ